ncbi:MAG: F0F1 ATP synthase subunit epsilon [Kiritimatiellae bacterium]|nr:F0F1 ATP synthase subunit epsilon [Kiritimatiellia bacterium]
MKFQFSILSPGGKAYEGEAEYVSAPGLSGGLGILARHAPMIAAVEPGVTTVKLDGETRFFYTGSGVLEVARDETLLLVDEVRPVGSADEAKELMKAAAPTPTAK